MTSGGLLCEAGAALRAAGIPDSRREARLLLSFATGRDTERLLRDAGEEVPPADAARFRELVRRRCGREPLAFLTGRAAFWTLDLEVSPQTLIPRPDSESVVELALRLTPRPRRVLDLGTGTGCLLLSVLAEVPDAWGLGVDLRHGATALACANARRNGLAARAAFLCGDWATALEGGGFDLILSNPPYIETGALDGLMPEVRRHEPRSALDGGSDGLAAYRRILPMMVSLMAPGGAAVLEVGKGQEDGVAAIGHAVGLDLVASQADLGGIPRALGFRAIGGTVDAP